MKRPVVISLRVLGLLWMLMASFRPGTVTPGAAQTPGLMVIANAKGCPATLTMKEVRSIFMGERQRWGDGTRIEIVLMDYGSDIGRSTAEKVYGKTPDQLKYFWSITVFSGKSDGPRVFEELEELQRYVASHPGAVAVINRSSDTRNRAILVDGMDGF